MKQARILAIDDSLTIRKLLERTMAQAGYQLELASNGRDGLHCALNSKFDLILLDYVLPDLKGIDLCRQLLREHPEWKTPIVLMSGKSQDVRSEFADIHAVTEFVGKPFTPPELCFVVNRVLNARDQASGVSPETISPDPDVKSRARSDVFAPLSLSQKEKAAKALFSVLRDRFARIPEWQSQVGAEPPAPFFARKILTPDLLDRALTALQPHMPVPADATLLQIKKTPSSALEGDTAFFPLASLFKELSARGRTGVLRIISDARRTDIFWRRGEMILATHDQPQNYISQSAFSLDRVPLAALEQALEEQRKTLKPVFATLAQEGHIPLGELAGLLYQQGERVLLETVEAGPARFVWTDVSPLPDFAEAHGRQHTLEQLELLKFRRVDDWSQIEMHVGTLELAFSRAENFTAKLARFAFNDIERRVLTLVDGRNKVSQIIDRAKASPFEVFHVLFCMSKCGLILGVDPAGTSGPRGGVLRADPAGRPVLIAEPDVQGIHVPLKKHLKQRKGGHLTNINGEKEVLRRIQKDSPRMVIVNAESSEFDLEQLAREVRSCLETSDVSLVAVLERFDAARKAALQAAGCCAVLVKPFHVSELDPLLTH